VVLYHVQCLSDLESDNQPLISQIIGIWDNVVDYNRVARLLTRDEGNTSFISSILPYQTDINPIVIVSQTEGEN
jgi:hypothetical protein